MTAMRTLLAARWLLVQLGAEWRATLEGRGR